MTFLDRDRAARLMAAAGLDALLLLSPESFSYATGAPAGVGTMWRRAGAVAALVPADPTIEIGAVVSDLFETAFRAASPVTDLRLVPLWVETADIRGLGETRDLPMESLFAEAFRRAGRNSGFARPETFDAQAGLRGAADLLAARGLASGRIGLEFDTLSLTDFARVQAALPQASLLDGSDVLRRLKMVKSPREIGYLRKAVGLAEAGIEALQSEIRPGVRQADLAVAWRQGVQAAAAAAPEGGALTGLWDYISVGDQPWAPGGVVAPGDLIKVDVGCLIAGYTSDTGRTFVCGAPTPLQERVFGALQSAFEVGLALIQPGVEMRVIHQAATEAMARAGLPGFSRGHFGHGLGFSLGSEEWPFFSATSDVVLEPGIVLAYETPFYVDGLGGLIIENQLLVTDAGHETMNQLPTGLVSV